MQKLTTFFKAFIGSISSPKYYRDILKAKFSFSVKYFLLLQVFLAVVTAARIFVPVTQFNVPAFAAQLKTLYPRDLQISLANGKLKINQPLPYSVPFPKALTGGETGSLKSLVVFDSDENVSGMRDVIDRQALAVITETSVYARKDADSSEMQSYPIPADMDPFTISSQDVDGLIAKGLAHPFIAQRTYVPILFVMLVVGMWPLLVYWRYSAAMIYALIIWLLFRFFNVMKGEKLKYGQALQVTLHSMTPMVLIAYILDILGQGQWMQGWYFFFAYLAFTWWVMRRGEKKGTTLSSSSSRT